jgi:hypothetical protein
MCDDSLWVDNKSFTSTILAADEFNPDAVRKKNAGPWVNVKKSN